MLQRSRDKQPGQPIPGEKNSSAAARRALAEAEERRRLASPSSPPAEVGGRGGLDPGRFGDWEVKGLASDF